MSKKEGRKKRPRWKEKKKNDREKILFQSTALHHKEES